MTLTTAYSQDQYIAPEKVNILQAINEIYNKKHQREKIEKFKEFESKSKIQDTVRIIKAQGTCLRLMATKRLFITMQTYASPLDTVIKIITNVKTFCNSKSFSMPLLEFDKAIMVIETVDNEIITLYSTSCTFDIERPSWTYAYTKNIYRHLHYWNINVENINKLKSGVKKIKIKSKCGTGLYEKEFEKDKIGTILYDGYLSELKQMAKDKNQDFKENF